MIQMNNGFGLDLGRIDNSLETEKKLCTKTNKESGKSSSNPIERARVRLIGGCGGSRSTGGQRVCNIAHSSSSSNNNRLKERWVHEYTRTKKRRRAPSFIFYKDKRMSCARTRMMMMISIDGTERPPFLTHEPPVRPAISPTHSSI